MISSGMDDAVIMEQNSQKIAGQYDSIAEEWAAAFAGEHEQKPKDQETLRRFVQEIGGRKPVWDIGCGTGNTTQYLKNLGMGISGLDLSEGMLRQARVIHPEIPFRRGNLLELDFENDSIAGIVAFYAIVHFSQMQVQTALQEVFRVLKPGGTFLFTFHVGDKTIHLDEFLGKELDMDFMFFSTESISRHLKHIGYERIEVIEREPYPAVEYESRRAYVFATKPG